MSLNHLATAFGAALLVGGTAVIAQEQADAARMLGWELVKNGRASAQSVPSTHQFTVPSSNDQYFKDGAYRTTVDLRGTTKNSYKDHHRDVVTAHVVIEASVSDVENIRAHRLYPQHLLPLPLQERWQNAVGDESTEELATPAGEEKLERNAQKQLAEGIVWLDKNTTGIHHRIVSVNFDPAVEQATVAPAPKPKRHF